MRRDKTYFGSSVNKQIQNTGDSAIRYRFQDTRDGIQDIGYRIQDTGYRIQDTGYRI